MVTFTGFYADRPGGSWPPPSDTLKKVFLELGGKSAAIVLDDADFNTAALFSGVLDGDPRRPGLCADVATAGAAHAPRRRSSS